MNDNVFAFARVDPSTDTHYAISESAEFMLNEIKSALETAASLAEMADPDRGEVAERLFAPMFRTFSFAMEAAMSGRETVLPKHRSKPN